MDSKTLYTKLANFGRKLIARPPLIEGIELIATYAKDITGASRCSIFLHDKKKKILWTTLADNIDTITIDDTKGIAGQTLKEQKEIIVNSPYSDSNFLTSIDVKSGFMTKNLASFPIFNSSKEIIGVLQLLNKEDGFNTQDIRFIQFFIHYIGSYLELSLRYMENDKYKSSLK
jgi:GAF domain-containing protein